MDFTTIAQAYKKACANIAGMIKASSYKITHIMEEIGLGRAAFYARLKAENWEPQHLETFGRIFEGDPRGGAVTSTISAN